MTARMSNTRRATIAADRARTISLQQKRLAVRPTALYEPSHQQPFASQHDHRRVLNERVAAASQEQRQRLLQQLVEAQHALRRQHTLRQQREAQRQQAAWRHAADQRAASCQAGFGAGVPFSAAGASCAADSATSRGPSGWQPPTASAQQHQQQDPRPQQQQQQPRHQYQRSHHRHYGRPIDLDDCWGRGTASAGSPAGGGGGSTGAHSSAAVSSSTNCGGSTGSSGSGSGARGSSSPRQGRRTSYFSAEGRRSTGSGINNGGERAWWRGFAHDAAGGFRFHPGGGGQHEAWAQQAAAHSVEAGGAAALEAQVRGELQQLLSQSGGDLLAFVAALGIRFEAGPDRAAAMRNARTAALLRLHPDHLMREGERQREFGTQATQLVNQLWRQRAASDR